MPDPARHTRCIVTKGRRVTLPVLLDDIQEFDQLVFAKVDGGYFLKKIVPATPLAEQNPANPTQKKVLYGVEIGQCAGNQRWYGIIVDRYGFIKCRASGSTQFYLRRELVELTDQRYRNKLNEKCGLGQWAFPILIYMEHDTFATPEIKNTVNQCRRGLADGTWPPQTRTNPGDDYNPNRDDDF